MINYLKEQQKYRVLILTDHRVHSPIESTYPLARALAKHISCDYVHVVSRGIAQNQPFFEHPENRVLLASKSNENLRHSESYLPFEFGEDVIRIKPSEYDVVILRMPRVNSIEFFRKISKLIPAQSIINQPEGIIQTGDKTYLLNFPEFCPPIRLCTSIEEVESFKSRFPIVLKPLNNSGGKGLVKISGDWVMEGLKTSSWQEFLPKLKKNISKGYLAMKFLKNVNQGDKRIIVANGAVVAAMLRMPPEDSWLCNVSLGAKSVVSEPDEEELIMVREIAQHLSSMGVVLFGIDTLVDDNGTRVLSELNTSCVNGIYPAEIHTKRPVVQETADLLWEYIEENIQPMNK